MFWITLKADFAKTGVLNYLDVPKLDLFEFLTLYENWRSKNG